MGLFGIKRGSFSPFGQSVRLKPAFFKEMEGLGILPKAQVVFSFECWLEGKPWL